MANSRIKRLTTYLRPYWRMVSFGILALLVVNVVGVYIPLLIRDSIDQLKSDFSFSELSRYALI
jgi:ATP-binding cassette, subfamily B, multidrug efflux pump